MFDNDTNKVKRIKDEEDFIMECNKLGIKVHKTDDFTNLDDIESLKECFSSWSNEEHREIAAFTMRDILLRDREKRRLLLEEKKKERELKRKSKNKRKLIKKSRKKGRK